MAPDELSPSQAARRIGATTRSVQRWIALGRLPARRLGGRWRVASAGWAGLAGRGGGGGGGGAGGGGSRGIDDGGGGGGRAVSGERIGAHVTAGERAGPSTPLMRPHVSQTEASAASAPIHHLFIANRGEIARRIARTCARLGIQATTPETEGGARGEAGGGVKGNALDLLDIDLVVRAAQGAGADAVHPGFGFLAENAAFAEAVVAAGMLWVGPPPAAIRAMGDKAAARRLAGKLGVPVIPGYDGEAQADATLTRAARRIGYPILVKPAAGGGGKGMRVVRGPASLSDALGSARREALTAFGDERLILERLVEGPRHVEVQVLFDRHGSGIHLGERDCSVQRRHQKIFEETPSPAVDEPIRNALTSAALRLAAAVGYESAGTCEFLLADDGSWFFLEMNTRLQVEHPVTEAVTGRDLVADQLRIAAGEALGVAQAEVDEARRNGGHAIEVRLYAEDAEDGFLPATGRVARLRWPSGPGIRVDAGIDEGDTVTGKFDPMLAKMIAHGADRAEALARLAVALDETTILGLTTNLRFLRWLVREPVIRDGAARIDTLDRIWPPDDWAARVAIPDEAWAAAASALAARALAEPGVASGQDGWRLNAPRRLPLTADDGAERRVELREPVGVASDPASAVVVFDGVAHLDVDGRSVGVRRTPPPDVDRAARAAVAHHVGGSAEVVAPMPGSVVAVHFALGAIVAVGDPIVTLEAMKMEHAVIAPMAGRITELRVRRSDQVTRGQALAVVEG